MKPPVGKSGPVTIFVRSWTVNSIAQECERRIDDFGQIVWRDLRRHADRDAVGTVDEQVRHASVKLSVH